MARMTKKRQYEGFAEIYQQVKATGEYEPVKPKSTKPVIASAGDNAEKSVQKEIQIYINASGGVAVITTNGLLYTRYGGMVTCGIPGLSDIVAVLNGRYLEIECKARNGGTLSIDQIKHGRRIILAGGIWLVGHSRFEIEYKLKNNYQEINYLGEDCFK